MTASRVLHRQHLIDGYPTHVTVRVRVSLVRVARVYREAVQSDLPPIKTVSEVIGLTYTTARRKVREAKLLGLLNDPSETALIHRPATAIIHRGTDHERRFSVCEACLVPYPCEVMKEFDSAPGGGPSGGGAPDSASDPVADVSQLAAMALG